MQTVATDGAFLVQNMFGEQGVCGGPCTEEAAGRLCRVTAPDGNGDQEFAVPIRSANHTPSAGNDACGVFVRSCAGHCSDSGGSACSLPMMRSTAMA